ncbi:MAG: hypothetical protein JMN25_09065 [gamma proteobacterium endosymbiont of Lamellibrachia anaximandri]|nr:hypothetical protein [gamma proteobacterium endosymbiont of Lamellibrachia anaximandri]
MINEEKNTGNILNRLKDSFSYFSIKQRLFAGAALIGHSTLLQERRLAAIYPPTE